MIPKFIIDEIEHWTDEKSYGELNIIFQNGYIQRWTRKVSYLPPTKSSGTILNPGEATIDAPKGEKLEEK